MFRSLWGLVAGALLLDPSALVGAGPALAKGATAVRARLERRMHDTVRADYRGETDRLRALAQELAADTSHVTLGAYAHYWRAFALQRRAFNLMNDDPKGADALADLRAASEEFERIEAHPVLGADALAAHASCIMSIGASARDADSVRASIRAYLPLLAAAERADPANPRVAWVRSMSVFFTPASAGGGPDSAIALMARGVEEARARARAPRPRGFAASLAPAWGEPEGLVNLAWFWFARRDTPNLARAQGYLDATLRLVPDWRFARDILAKQIDEARASARN